MDNTFLLLIHSILRYVLLLFLLVSILFSLRGVITKAPILIGHRAVTVWTVMVAHIQLVIGLILYIMGGWHMADHSSRLGRFWKMEHIAMMVLAVILITVGRVMSKKAKSEYKKQMHILVFFLIALLMILAAIPWPFREVGFGRGWI